MDDPWIFWGARVKKALSSEEITPSPHFPSTIQNLAKKEGRESRHFNHDLSNNACVCAREGSQMCFWVVTPGSSMTPSAHNLTQCFANKNPPEPGGSTWAKP